MATLPNDFREAFPDLVSDLCASTIDYSLGDTSAEKSFADWQEDFHAKSKEYHEKINCLFNESFVGLVTDVNREVQKDFGSKKLPLDTPPKISESCKKVYQTTQASQQQRHLKNGESPTVCDPDGNYPSVSQTYSACNVAQTVLTEFCGYQKYVWARIRDDATFLGKTVGGESVQRYLDEKNDWKNELQTELDRSKATIENTILLYQKFEQNYRLHARLIAIQETLRGTLAGMTVLQRIFQTFPEKFINASTP